MSKKKTQDEFIAEVKAVHGSLYSYSLVNYVGASVKVKIICKKHGVFEQLPTSHKQGFGCGKCAINLRATKFAKSTHDFIIKANSIHNNRYDYGLVKYINSLTAVKIICKKHGIFEQTPKSHNRGGGCPNCHNEKRGDYSRLTNRDFIERSIAIHGNKYDYSLCQYKSSRAKVRIVCKEHGIFMQRPNCHLNGRGCAKCGDVESISKRRNTLSSFLQRAKTLHGNKYDYSLVKYVSGISKVSIKCPIHGVFEQIPKSHLKGGGCPDCWDERRGVATRTSIEEFIDNAIKVHGNKYDYSKVVYTTSKHKVKIICKAHGVFEQLPNNHLSGNGCRSCRNSRGELRISTFLRTNYISFEREKQFDNCRHKYKLPFDFFIPSANIVIEFDGIQHFQSCEFFGGDKAFKVTQKRDRIKDLFAKKNGLRLIRIKYTDFDKIEEILSEALNITNHPSQLTLFAA